jgi:hypothetical protein
MIFRCGEDGQEGTDDDNSLDDLHSAVGIMARVVTLNENEFKSLENFLLSGLVSTRSSHIRVDCTGFLNKKNKAVSISCVADINGKVLYWKERRHMAVRRVFL